MPGAAQAASQSVSIAVSAGIAEDTLVLRGELAAPDGAWVAYAAYSTERPSQRARGLLRVEDERFGTEVRLTGWPSGRIRVDVHFQMILPGREQPEAVVDRFGSRGELMEGPEVVRMGEGYRAAVASTTVVKR